jgi:hypothetical protein
VILMALPSKTAARDWYKSLDSRRILHLRANYTISDLILVEGVRPDFTVAQLRTADLGRNRGGGRRRGLIEPLSS